MSREPAIHEVRVYYEDTDFSGAVYHASYLRFMERAREHLLGPDELVRLWEQEQTGFVVYKIELTYREPARFGDVLQIRTTPTLASEWRIDFQQDVWRGQGKSPLVLGKVELVCVDGTGKLVRLPASIRQALSL